MSPFSKMLQHDQLRVSGWLELESHDTGERVPLPPLIDVVDMNWEKLRKICPGLPATVEVDIDFDRNLSMKHVLGYASRTMLLSNRTWVSSLMFDEYHGTDVKIRINPNVPGGWYFNSSGVCDIGWQYDLNSVVMHEIIHGIGISSSITGSTVGYMSGDQCYPTLYDTKIRDTLGYVVEDCSMRRGTKYTMGGVPLYVPDIHNPGSSYSHHNVLGHSMYYKIAPRKCTTVGFYEVSMLNELGVDCNVPINAMESNGVCNSLHILILLFCLCLMR